ncbi:M48 family metallopeptidase [Enterovibrio nigricans]|uniref:Peptidase family M48 n=1 Tax=Enterovibrio nigricans DSM 22720 TaxID=1121868 RepID=A0A1T4UPB8_9GAMM|nr:M48 family metallopeptidase [Enterovibrio nigricans]PKF50370.1 Zn-dependent protease with chaperone function [Enterovibrio nigricans]SKA54592.1 Peptidase family M48 [Enterovibrio nigricans DSM 22720]
MTEGFAYHVGNSTKFSAELFVLGSDRVLLRFDDTEISCAIDELECAEQVGNLPTQFRFPNGELFVPVSDAELPQALSKKQSWIQSLESNKTAVVGSIVSLVVFILLFFKVGIPALSTGVTHVLPNQVPLLVGEHVMTQLDDVMLSPSELSDDEKAKISRQFDSIVASLPEMPLAPNIVFRSWKGGANAFALSDGTIILLDPLVEMAESEAQLESVILHELGHVYHQHVMKSLVRSALLSVSVAVITGESTGAIDTLTGVGVLLASSGYSREAEEESDRFASKYLTQRYGDATAQADMFSLMKNAQSNGALLEWLSSHPDMDNRIEAARRFTSSE